MKAKTLKNILSSAECLSKQHNIKQLGLEKEDLINEMYIFLEEKRPDLQQSCEELKNCIQIMKTRILIARARKEASETRKANKLEYYKNYHKEIEDIKRINQEVRRESRRIYERNYMREYRRQSNGKQDRDRLGTSRQSVRDSMYSNRDSKRNKD